jgi:hypothetical protein
MKTLSLLLLTLTLSLLASLSFAKSSAPHYSYDLWLTLPNQLRYELAISGLPKGTTLTFLLNSGLKIESVDRLDRLAVEPRSEEFSNYTITDSGDGILRFKVSGEIRGEGLTSAQAMILNSGLYWSPFAKSLFTYEMSLHLTEDLQVFTASSNPQNCGDGCLRVTERRLQEDLFLVVGHYFAYVKKTTSGHEVGVFLFADDRTLAETYLELLPQYLERYQQLFGTYLYEKFFVIENFNETGFGMPGFTLLGSSVIRLPFILKSSLPHEVLHNWWGNGVYVDYAKGNWCEGLTTYFADHLEAENADQSAKYRREALTEYADFVAQGGGDGGGNADFPLVEFTSRHDEASQAIGYGKSMMFFHMLSQRVGAKALLKALKKLYEEAQFQSLGFIGFMDILAKNLSADFSKEFSKSFKKSFSKDLPRDLKSFYLPWLTQKGSVKITAEQQCDSVDGNNGNNGNNGKTKIVVRSVPPELSYSLAFEFHGPNPNPTPTLHGSVVVQGGRGLIEVPEQNAGIPMPGTPMAGIPITDTPITGTLKLDPNFEVFRELYPEEKPLTFSRILSASRLTVVVQSGYEAQAASWIMGLQNVFAGVIDWKKDGEELPTNFETPRIYFGTGWSGAPEFLKLIPNEKIIFKDQTLEVEGLKLISGEQSWILMGEDLKTKKIMLWASPADKQDAGAWGRQLTHYSKFGILAFDGKKNIFKTAYATGGSPMELPLRRCP